eukprot:TRINITY_DN10165_c0_g1_i1.p1 TRINITY_DN10165_c0_g1~~TRINITY_DN10165_c0_g1_i1.p1  ORF type:complete len:525 (+),score=224.54 TRINITY_DN10165_c0_g1_i1:60-1577(+)
MSAPADLLPLLASDYPYSDAAKQAFLERTKPFSSQLSPAGYTLKSDITTAQYLQWLNEDSCVRCAVPEIKRNALDLAQSYHSLGNDTKALRRFYLSGIARLEGDAVECPLSEVYAAWEADHAAREKQAFVRSELESWELFTRRKATPAWDPDAAFLKEMHHNQWESAFLEAVRTRLEEIRNFDGRGKVERSYKLKPVVPVEEMPNCQQTELYKFCNAAQESFLNRTRPFASEMPGEEEQYLVQTLTAQQLREHWSAQSLVSSQRADILANAKDASKSFSDLGVTTKKVRLFLHSGLDRLAAAGDKPLAQVFTEWVADHQERELRAYVRSELANWELHEQRKKKPQWSGSADFAKESQHSEYEKAFLGAVRSRLNEIRRLDEDLTRTRDDAARREREESERESKKAAEAEEKATREAEAAAKKKAEAEAREASKKADEERRAQEQKERDDYVAQQKDAAAASVNETKDKMALYQAEMAELQKKMMAGEIDGAAFGAAVAGLSQKYF